ncbi:MAG: ABC transporter ATP-binding protein [Alphaproteobacteria bacterium]|nr:ABC transporter ATP-binding protein [Rickettsiales bacterium]
MLFLVVSSVLVGNNIVKSFTSVAGKRKDVILNKVNINIAYAETVAIVGSSGCGKTTLLQLLGLIDIPDSGNILLDGQNCCNLTESERSKLLAKKIGFVYQFHHLLPEFTALENVVIGCVAADFSFKEAELLSIEALTVLGLKDKINKMPNTLSGGERQRVAIARAIAKKPKILLADEPTGNLDPNTGKMVFDALLRLVKSFGLSLLCVTHNADIANRMQRVLTIQDLRKL